MARCAGLLVIMRPSLHLRTLFLCLLAPTLALAQELRFTTLDVGQGDAAVLVTPSGCVALFDGGPTGSGATIKAHLRTLGVTRVDMAFISHFHADHMGGIDEVEQGADGIPIAALYDHGGTYASSTFDEYAAQFQGRRHTVSQGQTLSLCSEMTFKVVAANGNGTNPSDENARSVVVQISYGAFDALVGGDLTGVSPADMESAIASSVGELELYKVHHHGSKYSSNATFLAATKPLVSFISVGVGNPYGHPTPECLSRLSTYGSDIWMTEDPAANKKLGHLALSSASGNTFTVSQGGTSIFYTSKGVSSGSDTQPPSVPGPLVATAPSASEVSLSWSASSDNVGVTGYRVYRSTDGAAFSLAGTASTGDFTDAGRLASTSYWYRVTALDAAGNESAVSNTASATTQASSTPARVILNEILANENGSDTSTEFVEVVNVGGTAIDLGGWTLSDAAGVKHTFAAGTRLGAGKGLVIFGGAGGIPAGMGNAIPASTGTLGLNNTGDSVSLRDARKRAVDAYTYASGLAAVDGVSMNRSPDLTPGAGFVLHTSVSLLSASPGTRAHGGAL
jgi:beta-lactamase superfamily II metal-dependent hydrolase/chitodextrinase